jgi:hypothetical protein
MPPEPAAGALFDARRRLYYAKPALRGWLHAVWFGASLVAGPLLVARGHGARAVTALAVYTLSVTGLFGISALHHRGTWGPDWSVRLQRVDHLPPALAGPVTRGVRLPRGLPRVRVRGGHLPVRRDNTHHGTNRQLARP